MLTLVLTVCAYAMAFSGGWLMGCWFDNRQEKKRASKG